MKVHYKQSIKKQLDELYQNHYSIGRIEEIGFIELSEYEYIQFLEELGPTVDRILLKMPGQPRTYKGMVLKVMTA